MLAVRLDCTDSRCNNWSGLASAIANRGSNFDRRCNPCRLYRLKYWMINEELQSRLPIHILKTISATFADFKQQNARQLGENKTSGAEKQKCLAPPMSGIYFNDISKRTSFQDRLHGKRAVPLFAESRVFKRDFLKDFLKQFKNERNR